jgi:predicted metal-binding membrane protein
MGGELRHRPALAVGALLILSWGVLIAMFISQQITPHSAAGPTAWWCMSNMTQGAGSQALPGAVVSGLPIASLMSAAMMLPGALPVARRIKPDGEAFAEPRAILAFLATYLGMWVVFNAAALGLRAALPIQPGMLLAAAIGIATAWHLTPQRRQALDRCRAFASAPAATQRVASRYAGACFVSCWAIMLVMAFATSGQLIWTTALTALVSAEKLLPQAHHPRLFARAS